MRHSASVRKNTHESNHYDAFENYKFKTKSIPKHTQPSLRFFMWPLCTQAHNRDRSDSLCLKYHPFRVLDAPGHSFVVRTMFDMLYVN